MLCLSRELDRSAVTLETESDLQRLCIGISLVVPYDGSVLSRAALVRAVQFDEAVFISHAVPSKIPELEQALPTDERL